MDLLLDEEGRRLNHKGGPIPHVLAAPDELRVEIAIAALVRYLYRALIILLHQSLIFSGRDILS